MLTGWILELDGTWTPRIFFGLAPGSTMADLYSHASKIAASLERDGITVHLMGF